MENKELIKLTDCEELVMSCVWDIGEDVTLLEVIDATRTKFQKDWKRQTVSTFLLHLVDKEYLSLYRSGKVFYYHPLVEKEYYKKIQSQQFIDFWYDGSPVNLVATLCKDGKLTKEDIESLKELF